LYKGQRCDSLWLRTTRAKAPSSHHQQASVHLLYFDKVSEQLRSSIVMTGAVWISSSSLLSPARSPVHTVFLERLKALIPTWSAVM
jgi:hypothetical protein